MDSRRQRTVVRITVWTALVAMLLAGVSSLVGTATASGHSVLKSVAPADRATVSTPPAEVVLTFNEPVSTSFATVTVTGPGGPVSEGRPAVSGPVVTQALRTGLAAGTYTVAFRVVSEDGHPVSARTTFVVAASTTTTSSPVVSAPSGAASSGATSSPAPAGTATGTQSPSPTTQSTSGDGSLGGLILAVGVGALGLAAGVALIARTRRKEAE